MRIHALSTPTTIIMRCLFLMGAHRSGTSWLHQLLDSSAEFSALTYWEVLQRVNRGDPALCREAVGQELARQGGSRAFDDVRIGLDEPEEYGWLLEAKPFDLYTRRPISNTDFAPLEDLVESKCRRGSVVPWLLLKNPVDFYDGFLALDCKFPDAYFLFLHRHPLAVFRSQVMSWRHLWQHPNGWLKSLDSGYAQAIVDPLKSRLVRHSLYDPRYLERMLLTLAEAFELHVRREAEMKAQSMRLRYEDLCADPAKQLQRIAGWLNLQQPLRVPKALVVKPRCLGDDPMIRRLYQSHCHRFKAYCDWLKYDLEAL